MVVLNFVSKQWQELEPRERQVLAWGGLAVAGILIYALLLKPWHVAISHMEGALPDLRQNLVWVRQQSEAVKNGSISSSRATIRGQDQSLLSIVEQTAKQSNVSEFIQQIVPGGQESEEVRVVLEEANFNQWVVWIDLLSKQYGVDVKQVSAEREDDQLNIAEIRVTFLRS